MRGGELFEDEFVEEGGVGLAFAEAHDLADEEGGDGGFAGFELVELLGVGGDDFVDHGFEGAGVGDLFGLFAVVDGGEVFVGGEGGVEEAFELFGGELAVFEEVGGLDEAGHGDGRLFEREVGGVEAAAEFDEEQVGEALGGFGGFGGGFEGVGEGAGGGDGGGVLLA